MPMNATPDKISEIREEIIRRALSPETRIIEKFDYELVDGRGRPQFPGRNELIATDPAARLFYGARGRIDRRSRTDLIPAEHDARPGFFARANPRNYVRAWKVQTGLIRLKAQTWFNVGPDFDISGTIVVDVGVDLPEEYSLDAQGNRVHNPSYDPDGTLTCNEQDVVERWAGLLSANTNLVKTEPLAPGSIINVSFLTAGALQTLLEHDFDFHIQTFLATLTQMQKDAIVDVYTRTHDFTVLDDFIASNFRDIFNRAEFLSRRGLVARDVTFNHDLTTEERFMRRNRESQNEIRNCDLEDSEERARREREFNRKKEEIEHAKRLTELEYGATDDKE